MWRLIEIEYAFLIRRMTGNFRHPSSKSRDTLLELLSKIHVLKNEAYFHLCNLKVHPITKGGEGSEGLHHFLLRTDRVENPNEDPFLHSLILSV